MTQLHPTTPPIVARVAAAPRSVFVLRGLKAPELSALDRRRLGLPQIRHAQLKPSGILPWWPKVQNALLVKLREQAMKLALKLQRRFDGQYENGGRYDADLSGWINRLRCEANADEVLAEGQPLGSVSEDDGAGRKVSWFLRHDGTVDRVRDGGQS